MVCQSPSLCLCAVVYTCLVSVLISGAVYKFYGRNPCYHMEAETAEVEILTDGDVSSCEKKNGTTVDLFVFLADIHRRHLTITVIGSHVNCNPVEGLRVAISSISRRSHLCKIKFPHSPDRCHYRCSCMVDDVCSHITIGIPGIAIGEICEIKLGWH